MDLQKRQGNQIVAVRKGLKRKLEEDSEEDYNFSPEAHEVLLREIRAQVNILESTFSCVEADRAAANGAAHYLSELAKDGNFWFITFCWSTIC